MSKSLFDFQHPLVAVNSNADRFFIWTGLDNRPLKIPHDENMIGDEVSCFTELNDDMTIKYKFHEAYQSMMKVTRHLSMEDVTEVSHF